MDDQKDVKKGFSALSLWQLFLGWFTLVLCLIIGLVYVYNQGTKKAHNHQLIEMWS